MADNDGRGQALVVGGIDSHKDTHHVVVLDSRGSRLADRVFSATEAGYQQLYAWMSGFGLLAGVGIESTGSYAAGLTRYLMTAGVDVLEVNTPHPHVKARQGKTDVIDAEAAARKTLSGEAAARPKITTGVVESIRFLHITRDSAVKSRSLALVQLQDILITAPSAIRENITSATTRGKVAQCATLRPNKARIAEPAQAVKTALRSLAKRIHALDEEIAALDVQLGQLVTQTAPTLTSRLGIGTSHGAQLLITAGQNITRLHSESAFARLCGVAPIPASSGKTHRMRLHRGGDRQANRALHMIAVCRLRYDQRTIDYTQRRTTEGLSKKDILRCLKRYIAPEVFNDLKTDLQLT